jgi:hypothetical protein
MGQAREHPPVMLIMAAFSRHRAALNWARQTAEAVWGPVALASELFPFRETDYYAASMGCDLLKVFYAFERLIDPAELVSIKQRTNQWEIEYQQAPAWDEARPLNLDPGYLTEAKLVLASTKDHAHRLYLAEGIFAEVTLHYQHRRWRHREWTFADYRRQDYHDFFTTCRRHLRQRQRSTPPMDEVS